jgi:hypothetical protein
MNGQHPVKNIARASAAKSSSGGSSPATEVPFAKAGSGKDNFYFSKLD